MYKNDLYELISPNNDKNYLLIVYFKRTKKYFVFFSLAFAPQVVYITGKASHGLTPDLTVFLKLVALGVQFRRASTRKTKPRGTAIIFK